MKKIIAILVLLTFLAACSSSRKITKTGWSKKPKNNAWHKK